MSFVETRDLQRLSESISCAQIVFYLSANNLKMCLFIMTWWLSFATLYYGMQFRLTPPHLPLVHTIVTLVAERLSVNQASVMNLRQATRLLVLSHLVAAIHRRDHCCIEKGLGKRQSWNRAIYNDFTEHQKGNQITVKKRIVRQEQFCVREHYCKTVGRKGRWKEEADNWRAEQQFQRNKRAKVQWSNVKEQMENWWVPTQGEPAVRKLVNTHKKTPQIKEWFFKWRLTIQRVRSGED